MNNKKYKKYLQEAKNYGVDKKSALIILKFAKFLKDPADFSKPNQEKKV